MHFEAQNGELRKKNSNLGNKFWVLYFVIGKNFFYKIYDITCSVLATKKENLI
jgi:hypothetical protein